MSDEQFKKLENHLWPIPYFLCLILVAAISGCEELHNIKTTNEQILNHMRVYDK